MKLSFHMKSGKTLVQRGVKHYNFKYNNDQITAVNMTVRWGFKLRVLVGCLDLKSIEAVTVD